MKKALLVLCIIALTLAVGISLSIAAVKIYTLTVASVNPNNRWPSAFPETRGVGGS